MKDQQSFKGDKNVAVEPYLFLNLLIEPFVHRNGLNIPKKRARTKMTSHFSEFSRQQVPFHISFLFLLPSRYAFPTVYPEAQPLHVHSLRAARQRVNLMQSVALVIKHHDFLMKLQRANDFKSFSVSYPKSFFSFNPKFYSCVIFPTFFGLLFHFFILRGYEMNIRNCLKNYCFWEFCLLIMIWLKGINIILYMKDIKKYILKIFKYQIRE